MCNKSTVYQIDENALSVARKTPKQGTFSSAAKRREIITKQSEIFSRHHQKNWHINAFIANKNQARADGLFDLFSLDELKKTCLV